MVLPKLGALSMTLWLLAAPALAEQPSDAKAADEEERMDAALRKLGYVSGQAFQCHSKDQQAKLERTALGIANGILRLFGSDRAFFYAAAFGAGATEKMEQKACPAAIEQASAMTGQLKVLAGSR